MGQPAGGAALPQWGGVVAFGKAIKKGGALQKLASTD